MMNEAGRSNKPFLFGLNYELNEGFFMEDPLNQGSVFFQIGEVGNKKRSSSAIHKDQRFESFPIPFAEYERKFNIVKEGLLRGDSFLSNLTIKTSIETDLSLADIFDRSEAPYQLYIPNKFVCFSPERFVRIENGFISSNPMKGTIDANVKDAENIILSDFKETAEHNTIVDLIRNDLSIVAQKVELKKFRYIDKIKTNKNTILQVSSEIEGRLTNSAELGNVIFNLLPAGSISGAPKQATVELIRLAEGQDRGYYTGVFGYFDGQKLDTGVLIRYIEKQENELFFRSGGGITAYSKCEEEYKEVLDKIYLPFV